ncbi:glutaredoxin family protein [Chitinolyticbacter meiyuanensis]|uniref:glutaredoxin family protein n=1 Tax=Chitinolyticbacter meiyuanensis TaxID=682798 RepID=UPI0011E5F903|nr:glutaredoxin family protein [Chitinolyticbacter meiyuanensis]
MTLTLYGREYCGLCLTMRDQLALLGSEQGFATRWIDVDDDPVLEARYDELVPVLADPDDVEICHYHLDFAALGERLAKFR